MDNEILRLRKELNSKNRVILALKQIRSRKDFSDCISQWREYSDELKSKNEDLYTNHKQQTQKLYTKISNLYTEIQEISQGKISREYRKMISKVQKARNQVNESENRVLQTILHAPNPPFLAELATALDMRKNTLWYQIENLKRKNLIKTRRNGKRVYCYPYSSINHSNTENKIPHTNRNKQITAQNFMVGVEK